MINNCECKLKEMNPSFSTHFFSLIFHSNSLMLYAFSLDVDRIAMEKCDSVVVVSAIFNDHDKIRQPKGLGSNTLQEVCFFYVCRRLLP